MPDAPILPDAGTPVASEPKVLLPYQPRKNDDYPFAGTYYGEVPEGCERLYYLTEHLLLQQGKTWRLDEAKARENIRRYVPEGKVRLCVDLEQTRSCPVHQMLCGATEYWALDAYDLFTQTTLLVREERPEAELTYYGLPAVAAGLSHRMPDELSQCMDFAAPVFYWPYRQDPVGGTRKSFSKAIIAAALHNRAHGMKTYVHVSAYDPKAGTWMTREQTVDRCVKPMRNTVIDGVILWDMRHKFARPDQYEAVDESMLPLIQDTVGALA